ncbi:MAG: hypothetical protein R3C28_26695 [Pirellulaceae bacterium]
MNGVISNVMMVAVAAIMLAGVLTFTDGTVSTKVAELVAAVFNTAEPGFSAEE